MENVLDKSVKKHHPRCRPQYLKPPHIVDPNRWIKFKKNTPGNRPERRKLQKHSEELLLSAASR
jgi:hypothetical protein